MRKRIAILVGILALLCGALPVLAQDAPGGRICVTAFEDANRNGLQEPIEPLLPNVAVYLLDPLAVTIASYVTDGRSEPHCFTDLPAGTFVVNFDPLGAEPTGETSFSVTLIAGQALPAQVHFGAVPGEAVSSRPAASPEVSNTPLRALFAGAGAGFVMVMFVLLGVVIYAVRYRRG